MRSDRILSIFLFFYILVAIISKFLFKNELGQINVFSVLYSLAFVCLIIAGYKISKKGFLGEKRSYFYVFAGLLMGVSIGVPGLISSMLILLIGIIILNTDYKIKEYLFYIGVGLVIFIPLVAVFNNVIPILNPEMRTQNLVKIYSLSIMITALLISYRPNLLLLLFGGLMALVSTFRSYGVLIFFTYFFRTERKKKSIVIGSMILISIFLVRFIVLKHNYPVWRLGFFKSLIYRIGFSFSVFEKLFEIGLPFGEPHNLLLDPNAKSYVAGIFGATAEYTYTIFGQPAHDIGILGFFEAILLGMGLRDTEQNSKFKSLYLGFSIIIIEIGLDALRFGILMGLAYFAIEKARNQDPILISYLRTIRSSLDEIFDKY